MTIYPQRLLPVITLTIMLLTCPLVGIALAQDLASPNIGTITTINVGDSLTDNGVPNDPLQAGTVGNNNGTIINNNVGSLVDTNVGEVSNNYGEVTINNGRVGNNAAGGEITENNGLVDTNNYGTVNNNHGTVNNNHGTISDHRGTLDTNRPGGFAAIVSGQSGVVDTNHGALGVDGTLNSISANFTNSKTDLPPKVSPPQMRVSGQV